MDEAGAHAQKAAELMRTAAKHDEKARPDTADKARKRAGQHALVAIALALARGDRPTT